MTSPAGRRFRWPEGETTSYALIVVDFQRGFDDLAHWSATGRRDNPACEANVVALVAAWREAARPVVFVRHDSTIPGSLLAPGSPANALRPELTGTPDLLVTKTVNSAFHGDPDLGAWLRERSLTGIAVCGVQTDHCVETTARVGANLGFETLVVLDACHTVDRRHPDGGLLTAEQLSRATAASLHGEFATIVSTAELTGEPSAAPHGAGELAGSRVRLTRTVEADARELREIRRAPEVALWWDEVEPDFPLHDESDAVRYTIRFGDAIVGMIQYGEELEPKYRHASIDIFVAPSHHGRGIGSEAVGLLARHLVEDRGHHRLVIDPAAHNHAAIAAYRKAGFEPVGVMRRAERDSNGRGWHDVLLMELVT